MAESHSTARPRVRAMKTPHPVDQDSTETFRRHDASLGLRPGTVARATIGIITEILAASHRRGRRDGMPSHRHESISRRELRWFPYKTRLRLGAFSGRTST